MIQLEPMFEKVKYNALDYIGLYREPVSTLSSILSSVVESNGVEIMFDTVSLADAMRQAGAGEAEIHRVCLMAQVAGLREVLNRDPRTMQLDLDRYIQNAIEETGLNRDTILRITSAISYATGIALNYKTRPPKDFDHITDNVSTLAQTVCQERLDKFREDFERLIYRNYRSTVLDFEMLEPLVQYGIPQAKYYMGYCLLEGIQVEKNEARGVELLQEAAEAGVSKAAAMLGDHYFAQGGSDSWTKAYDYYTGYGAMALNRDRKSAIVSILNHKQYNKKMLGLCIVLFLALVATVIWSPAAATFAAYPFWGWLAVVAQLALLVLKIIHYRVKPYDCVYILPFAMAAIWFVYMAIRLLF